MNFEKNIYHIILFTDQISLTDCFYFLIAFTNFICCPVCDAINFEINLRFLIKPYLCITKKSGQECKYLKNKHNLKIKEKAFSVIFKGLAVVRKCPKPENGPLKFELNFKFMKISWINMLYLCEVSNKDITLTTINETFVFLLLTLNTFVTLNKKQ